MDRDRLRALIEEMRKEAAAWQHGIGDNGNTRLLTLWADKWEAALAAPDRALPSHCEKTGTLIGSPQWLRQDACYCAACRQYVQTKVIATPSADQER